MAQRDKLLLVPVITPADVLETPHYSDRQFWDEIKWIRSKHQCVPGPWAHGTPTGVKRWGKPPLLGEHTDEVLSETES